jgi:uncharacterized protein (DUF1015 family)
MADVRPFKGLRYNLQTVGELSDIISPPFDTIPPELQKSLHRRSPYNVVRLEAGEKRDSDTPQDNRYTRSAALLKEWMDGRVLVREEKPAFYLVQHTFKTGDGSTGAEEPVRRLELMACVRLEEYERRVVLPHEYTRDEDKRDRLALMEACRANFSPIMCLYRDEGKRLSPIFQRTMAGPPKMDFSGAGDQGYKVWQIDDPEWTGEINEAMSSRPLYIADGHHRYETALTYRDLAASRHSGTRTGYEASNFVMMGLVEFDDPGLMVLPYHRVLGGLDDAALDRVMGGLDRFFDAAPFPEGGRAGLGRFLEEIELRGRDHLAMGLLGPGGDGYRLLTLKPGASLDAWGPIAQSEAWVLEEQVLKPVLGVDSLRECVDYLHDGDEADGKVKNGQCQLAFFLKPFPLDLFETVMNMGQRLPPKSTFFYPKLATGLTINLLEGTL